MVFWSMDSHKLGLLLLLLSLVSKQQTVFEYTEFVSQVAHDRDTYATSNISP